MKGSIKIEEKIKTHMPVWKSLLLSIGTIALLIPVVFGFAAMKIPFWPMMVFVFYSSVVLKMDTNQFYAAAVGGFIGILIGFSSAIFGQFLGKGIGELIFLILLVLLIAMLINGRSKYVNHLSNLFLLSLTLIAPSESRPENFFPVLASYTIAALLYLIVFQIKKYKLKTGGTNPENQNVNAG